MKVVLYHPEIPQNTGNIGRLCVATNTPLILVKPLGFTIDSKHIRRSGLDYWKDLNITLVDSLEEVREKNPQSRLWFLSTKGKVNYSKISYQANDILVFGCESAGLGPENIEKYSESLITIPMWGPVRSLNLSSSVALVVYEAYRQLGFKEMPDLSPA